MKTTIYKSTNDFSEYALSNEEMIYVRGGEADPVIKPMAPPIEI